MSGKVKSKNRNKNSTQSTSTVSSNSFYPERTYDFDNIPIDQPKANNKVENRQNSKNSQNNENQNALQDQFPLLAARSDLGLHIFEDLNKESTPPSLEENKSFLFDPVPEKSRHRCMLWSKDGSKFVYVNEVTGVHILDVKSNKELFYVNLPKTSSIELSPTSRYLTLYQPNYVTKSVPGEETPKLPPNVTIWDLDEKSKINEFTNKSNWGGLIWSPKDEWYARISADSRTILFYEPNDGNKVSQRFASSDNAPIKAFSVGLGRGKSTVLDPLVAIFTPEYKAVPAKIKIYRYPNFTHNTCLASKSFFKAEDAILRWSDSAQSLCCLASTEVDKSGVSYYGTSQLHHLTAKGAKAGDAALVTLSKSGPVYDVKWQPFAERFCVVHGYMPSNATVFRSPKLDIIFHWENISRNECLYSPGNTGLLALVGFGNLPGNVSVYKTDKIDKICEFESKDTTQFEWAADGKHFVAATTTPRLRIDNRLDILTLTGVQKFRLKFNALFEVSFQLLPDYSRNLKCNLTENDIKVAVKETKNKIKIEDSKKFIPPHLRKIKESQKPAATPVSNNLEKTYKNKIKALKQKLNTIKNLKNNKDIVLNSEQILKIKKEKEYSDELAEVEKKFKELGV